MGGFNDHNTGLEEMRAERDAAIAAKERAERERDEAVREANRRDQKWMDGIDQVCGRKIAYHEPFLREPNPTLDQFINGLRRERDEALANVARAEAIVRDNVAEVKNHHGGVVGYSLCLDPEDTERLWKLVDYRARTAAKVATDTGAESGAAAPSEGTA